MVDKCKYLRAYLDSRLDWRSSIKAINRKLQSRLYFMRKLRLFKVCNKMLQIFYQSLVASCNVLGQGHRALEPATITD